jgi:hypothetical protein
MPLILGGWVGTSDRAKHDRWLETVGWALQQGLLDIVSNMTQQSMYMFDEMSTVEKGQFLSWYSYHEPKPRPTTSEVTRSMNHLRSAWMEIAGPEVGSVTSPKRFTGKKRRKLVVSFTTDKRPPWGGWSYFTRHEPRKPFTRLRAAVNAAIKPHHVDHIDFVAAKNQTA